MFNPENNYSGQRPQNVEIISPASLLTFAKKKRTALPLTIRVWIDQLYPQD